MSYGLNVEMHKQTEICKRLDAIIRQVLPFLSAEHQQQVALAVDRAKQITITELNAVMQVNTYLIYPFFNQYYDLTDKIRLLQFDKFSRRNSLVTLWNQNKHCNLTEKIQFLLTFYFCLTASCWWWNPRYARHASPRNPWPPSWSGRLTRHASRINGRRPS